MARPPLSWTGLGEETADPVLLLHGFTVTHHTWDLLSSLLSTKHRVVLPDLPGHGGSAALGGMSVEATSDSLAQLVDKAGLKRVSVVGYSLGGRIALDFACRHPGKVRALALEGASPGIEDPDERRKRREDDASLADEIEKRGINWFVDYWQDRPLFATQRALPRDVVAAVRRDRLSNTANGLASSLRASGPGSMTPLWSAIESLDVPVMLVAGQLDQKFVETGTAMKKRIPRSSLVEVEGAGHCVHVEKPAEFGGLLGRFLDEKAPPPRARTGGSR